jgi:hypothetical protein
MTTGKVRSLYYATIGSVILLKLAPKFYRSRKDTSVTSPQN